MTIALDGQEEGRHKSVALEDLAPMAKVHLVSVGLPATSRCAVCDAQAYVEVEIFDSGKPHMNTGLKALLPGESTKRTLEFCAHHYADNESALILQAVRVVDHRPFLALQEQRFKGVNAR